jgi:hypothetical protein
VKTVAFVIGLCIFAVGAVGILAPSTFIWIAHHADAPVDLYIISAFRFAFGVLLFSVASNSRAPRTLRVVALGPILAAIALPFVGVERARATIEWWTLQGSSVIRLTGIPLMALGAFIAYACAPAKTPLLI